MRTCECGRRGGGWGGGEETRLRYKTWEMSVLIMLVRSEPSQAMKSYFTITFIGHVTGTQG